MNANLKQALVRFLVILAASVVLVGLGSELAFRFLKDSFDRPAETITLTIPYGTATKVAAGLEEPTIPSELSFVVGDTLLVYNDDDQAHELGPLYVPAGASASLLMDDESIFEYTCSFRPSKYLGMDVHEGTTLNIRLIGITYVSPATAVLIFIYSLALKPIGVGTSGERQGESDPQD